MTTTEFTKGPWKYVSQPVESYGYHISTVEEINGSYIGEVGGGLQSKKEILANAKLIAAAPDLLKALQKCTWVLSVMQRDFKWKESDEAVKAINLSEIALSKIV